MKSLIPYAVLAVLAVLVDQWIKFLVETRLVMHQPIDLLPFLALYRTYNTGIAFSMFTSFGDTALIVLSLAVVAFVLFLASRTTRDQVPSRIGFALIVGGAVGNLIDRGMHGHVIDYILFHTPLFTFAVFNLADALITVGAILVVFDEFLSWRRQGTADG